MWNNAAPAWNEQDKREQAIDPKLQERIELAWQRLQIPGRVASWK